MKEKDCRLLHPVIQQELRYKSIELFLKGHSQVTISKLLGMSTRSVCKYVRAYKSLGPKGLKIHKRGRPKGSQMKPWQTAQIVKLIRNYCPDKLSMPFFLWTRKSVGLLIEKKFNIKLSK